MISVFFTLSFALVIIISSFHRVRSLRGTEKKEEAGGGGRISFYRGNTNHPLTPHTGRTDRSCAIIIRTITPRRAGDITQRAKARFYTRRGDLWFASAAAAAASRKKKCTHMLRPGNYTSCPGATRVHSSSSSSSGLRREPKSSGAGLG